MQEEKRLPTNPSEALESVQLITVYDLVVDFAKSMQDQQCDSLRVQNLWCPPAVQSSTKSGCDARCSRGPKDPRKQQKDSMAENRGSGAPTRCGVEEKSHIDCCKEDSEPGCDECQACAVSDRDVIVVVVFVEV